MEENLEQVENDIIKRLKSKIGSDSEIDIKKEITAEIQKTNYLKEDWQKEYAYDRIFDKIKHELVSKMSNNEERGSIDSSKPASQLIAIKCNNCGNIENPTRWPFRTGLGIFYFFTIFNFIGIIIYFLNTNPYICSKCNERHKLVKVLNNGKNIPIKSLTKNTFSIISIVFVIIGAILLLLRLTAYDLA